MLKPYDPLQDPNLAAYFSHKSVQKTLVSAGLVLPDGSIVRPGAASSRVHHVTQEMSRVEAEEEALAKEEAEIRVSMVCIAWLLLRVMLIALS